MAGDRGDQLPGGAGSPAAIGTETAGIASFYDALSPFYHLIYHDWAASVERQATQLDDLIRERWGESVTTVLDAACGIGTQTFALAGRGYHVTASDISTAALERARAEAERRGHHVRFVVDDMRRLDSHGDDTFDLVIACDNAIPHLTSDAEILRAFEAFHRKVRPGGGCIISVRDYAGLPREGARLVPFGVRQDAGTRFVVFQVWEFDAAGYALNFYFLEDPDDGLPVTHVMRSYYYAITIDRLEQLMREAGFEAVERLDERFFQPLVVGTKPALAP